MGWDAKGSLGTLSLQPSVAMSEHGPLRLAGALNSSHSTSTISKPRADRTSLSSGPRRQVEANSKGQGLNYEEASLYNQ